MTWKQLHKPKAVPCTKEIVIEFAEMEPCPGDRHFNEKRAKVIKLAIIKETFRIADFASVYCRATGKTYRVNGKHTALVLRDLSGRLPRGLHALVERYEADTLTDVAEIYATFDHRRSSRQTGDINRSFAGADTDLGELPRRIVNACASGLAYGTWEHDANRHEAEEKAALLIRHSEFVAWVANLCRQDHKSRHLIRTAVVAAMFRTYGRNKKLAGQFWQLVADESHPSNKHPTRVLARWLLTHDIYAGAHHSGRQQLDTQRGMLVRCILAWNAFRQEETEVALSFNPQTTTPEAL